MDEMTAKFSQSSPIEIGSNLGIPFNWVSSNLGQSFKWGARKWWACTPPLPLTNIGLGN